MQDVLQAVEDGFIVLDLFALAGICLLTALKIGVDFTSVGWVLFVPPCMNRLLAIY